MTSNFDSILLKQLLNLAPLPWEENQAWNGLFAHVLFMLR